MKKKGKNEKEEKIELKTNIFTLPNLPKIEEIFTEVFRGPYAYSNWVIPGSLLVGAYPRSKNLPFILPTGVTKFICLMEDKELQRHGDYFNYNVIKSVKDPKNYSYIHFPIQDHGIVDDNTIIKFVGDLISWINKGEKIYMHCLGGHGRTGTIVSLLLSKLYSLDGYLAMEYCQAMHDTREENRGIKSPESSEQRNQVYRLAGNF